MTESGKVPGCYPEAGGWKAAAQVRILPSPPFDPHAGYTGVMKMAVSLPDSLFEAAGQLAKRLGMSRSELYAAAIEEYLRSHRNEGVTEALNRVYREEPSGLDPVISAIQAASLPRDAEWQGGKPKGFRGVVVRGVPVSETIIRDRR